MEKYYLGFDAGTQSVKVAVYDLEMNCLAEKVSPTHLYYPQANWVEMNVDEYLSAAKEGMKSCVQQLKEKNLNPDNIRAIFGDGIICGIAGVDESNNTVTPYINYLDSRTQEDAENISQKNLSIWGEESGNPKPNCMFPAMTARWILKNNENFKKHGTNLFIMPLIF